MAKSFDEAVRVKYNLTEDEFDYYIERMGFRCECDKPQNERIAALQTIEEIKRMRREK